MICKRFASNLLGGHPNPARHSLIDVRNNGRMEALADSGSTNQSPKNRAILDTGTVEPLLKPFHRLMREIRLRTLPRRIGLRSTDQDRVSSAPPSLPFVGPRCLREVRWRPPAHNIILAVPSSAFQQR